MAKSKVRKNKGRGGLVSVASIITKRDASSRHQRRKAEKLAKKHPSEVNKALRMLEERDVK